MVVEEVENFKKNIFKGFIGVIIILVIVMLFILFVIVGFGGGSGKLVDYLFL